jgi:long-subunit acyl-CoA synthetase (AMP-forming)
MAQVVSLDKGEAVGEGQRGELWFRTPFIMLGYKDRPDVSEEMLFRKMDHCMNSARKNE